MDIKGALEYIVGMRKPEIKDINVQTVTGETVTQTYSDKSLHHLKPYIPRAGEKIRLHTLSSLVEYIISQQELSKEIPMFVHVQSPTEVAVYSSLDIDREREHVAVVTASLPKFNYDTFMDHEEFLIAASIASVIACVGDVIHMPANGTFMIHKPSNGYFFTSMNADELRKDADVLDSCQKAILATYMTRTKDGVTEEQIEQMINEETWLIGSETADYFDFQVEDSVDAVACQSDFFAKYRKTPVDFAKQNQDAKENTKTVKADIIAEFLAQQG